MVRQLKKQQQQETYPNSIGSTVYTYVHYTAMVCPYRQVEQELQIFSAPHFLISTSRCFKQIRTWRHLWMSMLSWNWSSSTLSISLGHMSLITHTSRSKHIGQVFLVAYKVCPFRLIVCLWFEAWVLFVKTDKPIWRTACYLESGGSYG